MSGGASTGAAQPSTSDYPWLPDVDWAPVAPFWAAAREQRLVFPRCGRCGRFQWYPQDMCPECRVMAFEWTEVSASGYVFSHTTLRRSFVPNFESLLPLPIVLVKFVHAPGVTLVTNVLDAPEGGVHIDAEVSVVFPEVAPGVNLPMARLC